MSITQFSSSVQHYLCDPSILKPIINRLNPEDKRSLSQVSKSINRVYSRLDFIQEEVFSTDVILTLIIEKLKLKDIFTIPQINKNIRQTFTRLCTQKMIKEVFVRSYFKQTKEALEISNTNDLTNRIVSRKFNTDGKDEYGNDSIWAEIPPLLSENIKSFSEKWKETLSQKALLIIQETLSIIKFLKQSEKLLDPNNKAKINGFHFAQIIDSPKCHQFYFDIIFEASMENHYNHVAEQVISSSKFSMIPILKIVKYVNRKSDPKDSLLSVLDCVINKDYNCIIEEIKSLLLKK